MVYEESDDTFLMTSALDWYDSNYSLKDKLVLEMGCGNCYNTVFCAKHGSYVVGSDIDPKSISYCTNRIKNKLSSTIQSHVKLFVGNMFDSLREYTHRFDLIFFNPPYLISDTIQFVDLDGLSDGRYVIDKFLNSFDKFLKDDGSVLILHADYNNIEKTKEILSKMKYKSKIVVQKHLFFETLYVIHATKRN